MAGSKLLAVSKTMAGWLWAALACLGLVLGGGLPASAESGAPFSLPPLPYPAEALEPAIDATTMTIHHDRHHGGYVAKLNAQIAANPQAGRSLP